MSRSLNKATLIGNLTRDPEMRYTPQGTAVCTFGLATNRQWTTDSGDKKEEVEFHRIVAWNKLAELCAQLLSKGRKVFVEGRLQTRKWSGQDGVERTTTEIVINDMIILDSRGAQSDGGGEKEVPFDISDEELMGDVAGSGTDDVSQVPAAPSKSTSKTKSDDKKAPKKDEGESEESEDIPF